MTKLQSLVLSEDWVEPLRNKHTQQTHPESNMACMSRTHNETIKHWLCPAGVRKQQNRKTSLPSQASAIAKKSQQQDPPGEQRYLHHDRAFLKVVVTLCSFQLVRVYSEKPMYTATKTPMTLAV